jgi:SAM-dependent methyltransferase
VTRRRLGEGGQTAPRSRTATDRQSLIMPIAAHPMEGWNHNNHYHDRLLAAVPRPCRRALDVGCGSGAFARQLARLATEVDAVDRDAAVLQCARTLSAGIGNVRFIEADFLTWQSTATYDFVSMIASLHHLPFEEAMARAAGLLAPGGVLAILGLDRARSWLDFAVRGAMGYPVSRWYRVSRGTACRAEATAGQREGGARAIVAAPIREPEMTIEEILRRASELVPGATVCRHVLWRYSLFWRKPVAVVTDVAPPLHRELE